MYISTSFHLLFNFVFLCLVVDDEEPILDCFDLTSTTDSGMDSSSSVLMDPSASDNVDKQLTVTCDYSSTDRFLVGATTVTCTSSDAAGNMGTCSFVVVVTGNSRFPKFLCFSSQSASINLPGTVWISSLRHLPQTLANGC